MDYARLATQSLDLAIEALQDAKSGLSHSTLKPIVELLGNAPLVVVMGVGKSAHIGHKIAATLTSTGTKAVFLHPTEAMHGDMGIVSEKDAILAISYGGESVELLEALRYIKCAGVVAMSKHKNSSLAKSASYHLELKIKKEACGFNLVPTTSTTLSLALGDVLAVCLMAYKNFSQEDFAKSHPGGLLGKKMHLRVKDIYRTTNLPLVDANCCLHEALLEATAKGLGNALLVDSGGHLVGVLSDGDIRRALLQPENFDLNAPAKNYATLKPRIITDLDMLVVEALELIEQTQISLLVVCDSKNQVLGVLHLHTLLSLGLGS
ncbi:KpsF/GutQ family sugar-phosphate isomerase [Helicobacter sp. NHP22-001]|uniref:KpsF/GutQ family sugar-phosphate isomerase n=1 Tax=Helicobacter sp. NHP22-001 TaxID=3040202 RepID=UPI00244D8E11|nr:KpsF/GutQ family sugar-phosphate isomerase [Helicobacter sp. NHP22-001]GMB95704.1 Polysialic acid capsule expression protein KpsF [Helicobacter sp. NHP22-001]